MHRLLPLSSAELNQLGKTFDLEHLLKRGGFPEPYLAETMLDAERWRLQYSNSLLSTDIFDFDKVQNMNAMRNLFELLRHRVGSLISYKSLSEDLAISPNTVKKYIEILEAIYVIFRITPFSNNIARSLLKEPKIYFFDTALVHDQGAKLENLVATCLLKHVYANIDYRAEKYALHFLRTKDEEKVDFVLAKNNIVEKIIEVKNKNHEINKNLYRFHKKYAFNAVQVVKELPVERYVDDIPVMSMLRFLTELYL